MIGIEVIWNTKIKEFLYTKEIQFSLFPFTILVTILFSKFSFEFINTKLKKK